MTWQNFQALAFILIKWLESSTSPVSKEHGLQKTLDAGFMKPLFTLITLQHLQIPAVGGKRIITITPGPFCTYNHLQLMIQCLNLSGVYPKKNYINQHCFLQQCLCVVLTRQALHSSSSIAGYWSCGPGPTLNLQGRMAETASFPVGLWHLALSSVHRLSMISEIQTQQFMIDKHACIMYISLNSKVSESELWRFIQIRKKYHDFH